MWFGAQRSTATAAGKDANVQARGNDSEATASPVEEVCSFRTCSFQSNSGPSGSGLGDSHPTINCDNNNHNNNATKASKADFECILWDEEFPLKTSEKEELVDAIPTDAQALNKPPIVVERPPEAKPTPRSDALTGGKLTDTLCDVLMMGVQETDAHPGYSYWNLAPHFNGEDVPSIPLWVYARRLYRDVRCGDPAFICAMVLLDRALGDGRPVPRLDGQCLALTKLNVHRLLLTAVVIATKTLYDNSWKNSQFARFGGISVAELNKYELTFLKLIKFQTTVQIEEYELYYTKLAAQAKETKPTLFSQVLSCFAWFLP